MPTSGRGEPEHVSRVDARALQRTTARLVRAASVPWLHEEAARRMAEKLPLIRLRPRVVLDWSGPLGGSTTMLAAAYPGALVKPVNPTGFESAAPAHRPRARWWSLRRAAAPDTPAMAAESVVPGAAELVWSNMMLHAHADPKPVFEQWHRALASGGFLMFSTLGPGSLGELREIHRQQRWGDPMAPLLDMHDLGDMLVHSGFADPVMDQETLTLTWPDAQALLAELRALGSNVSPQRHPGLRTPRWRQRLIDALMERASDGRPSLSFELVYGHAFRAAPTARMQAQTEVTLDEMRAMVRAPRS